MNTYNIVANYSTKSTATVTIAAESLDEAKALFMQMARNHQDVEILQAYDVKDAPEMEALLMQKMGVGADGTPAAKTMN